MNTENIYIKVRIAIALAYIKEEQDEIRKKAKAKSLLSSIPRGSARPISEAIRYLNSRKKPFGIKDICKVTKYPPEVVICYYENYNIYGKYFKYDY
jgi:hypothetical protein